MQTQWRVKGVAKETGTDIALTIFADSREEAIDRAAGRGVVVSEINAVNRPLADQLFDEEDAEKLDRLNKERAQSQEKAPPAYRGLGVTSLILKIIAALFCLVAVLMVVVAIATVGEDDKLYALLVIVLAALGPFTVTALLFAASDICAAIRDIARNSFK